MKKFGFTKMICVVSAFCAAAAMAASAQTFTTIVSFPGGDPGSHPQGILQGADGNLYGTTSNGGRHGGQNSNPGDGTIFRITSTNTLESLYSFCALHECADGYNPAAGLMQAPNGTFYGTTAFGGSMLTCKDLGCGTIFKSDGGSVVTLYQFCNQSSGTCPDGAFPEQPLVRARNGNLYGTTLSGGSYFNQCNTTGCGTIFEITPSGTFTTLHVFCQTTSGSKCPDGYNPAGLTLGSDGNLYGTNTLGGMGTGHTGCPNGCGTIFRITPTGHFTTLYNFCAEASCSEGWGPYSGVTEGNDGNFYGTTFAGGTGGEGGGGTVFKVTTSGTLTTLYNFCALANCADGEDSVTPLILGSDGNFYGTTGLGGLNNNSSLCGTPGCGTIFEISPGGVFTSLYSFCSQTNCQDGIAATGALLQATNGTFYGTTNFGGTATDCVYGESCGTVYSLSTGLGPFVTANPNFGLGGQVVNILGTNLTGTTAVSFNGTAATFTVVSATKITATVPTGATTGTIAVTTPGGVLSGNPAFQVEP